MDFVRIQKELNVFEKNPPPNCSAYLKNESNLRQWEAVIYGPEDTPYQNGIFRLDIDLPENYPKSPPQIKFATKIYHPNVGEGGNICLDRINSFGNWDPAITISTALCYICALMQDPNPESYLNMDAANNYKNNRAKYDQIARELTRTEAC